MYYPNLIPFEKFGPNNHAKKFECFQILAKTTAPSKDWQRTEFESETGF